MIRRSYQHPRNPGLFKQMRELEGKLFEFAGEVPFVRREVPFLGRGDVPPSLQFVWYLPLNRVEAFQRLAEKRTAAITALLSFDNGQVTYTAPACKHCARTRTEHAESMKCLFGANTWGT